MRSLIAVTSLAAAMFASSPAGAQTAAPAPAPAPAPATSAALDQLLALTLPRDRLASVLMQGFDAGFDQQLATEPQLSKLVAAHPELTPKLRSDARAAMQAVFQEQLPVVQNKIGSFYTAHFTPEEISTLATFYATPTGRKLMAAASTAGADKALSEVKKGATGTDGEKLAAIGNEAQAAAARSVTADDMPVLMAFSTTSAAQKSQQLAPELQQVTIAAMRDIALAARPRVQQAMAADLKAYGPTRSVAH